MTIPAHAVGVPITKVTDEMPLESDVARVRATSPQAAPPDPWGQNQ
ncbi:hypothetical protein [Rhodococcus sp. NPDC004095]